MVLLRDNHERGCSMSVLVRISRYQEFGIRVVELSGVIENEFGVGGSG